MAEFYVYSGATGSGDGSSWANAFTTLAGAFSGKAAGDVFYVADDHAETQASAMAVTSPGTVDSPCEVLCVLRSGGSVPPVASDLRTTATLTTTGNNAISMTGSAYFYGLRFISGSGSTQSFGVTYGLSSIANHVVVFDYCLIKIATTGNSGSIQFPESQNINNRNARIVFNNTQLEFSAIGQALRINGSDFEWRNTLSPIAGTVPTTLLVLNNSSTKSSIIYLHGVDLSSLGSGKNLFNVSAGLMHSITIENCKLNSAVSITTGTQPGFGGVTLNLVNCDSSDTNYRYQKTDGAGTVTHETTIVRTGGASDGATSISRKMVSSARTKYYAPLFFDVVFWNDKAGSALNLSTEVVSDNVTFTDKELWMEVEALTTSGFPLGGFSDDKAATILTTGTNQTTSSATWTTTGLTTPVRQKLEVSVTPQEAGWMRCRINLAKPSSTVYVCPLVDGIGYKSGRQWQTRDAYLLESGAAGVRAVNIRGGADQ